MHYSLRAPAFAVSFLALASHSLHAQGSSRAFNEKAPTVPLSDVIAATESVLDDFQTYAKSPAGIKDGLPPLATANFDFKTVVDTKGGISINLFIFTIGASHEKQQTNDLDFTYMPHVEPPSKTVRSILCNDCPAFHRHHTSFFCASESSARFPWVIDTTFADRFILDGVASTH